MRKPFAILLLVALMTAVAPVFTITNGQPDGNAHPYVGLALQPVPGTDTFSICSGSAISPTVFITAAHCFDPSQPVFVTFETAPPITTLTPGFSFPHPAWCRGCEQGLQRRDTHDVAVIFLLQPVALPRYGELPDVGLVDTLAMKADIDLVGYGVQGFTRGGGPPQNVFLATRYVAPSQLVQSNNINSDEFIKLTANISRGMGGACFGDSGGPNLLGGTDVILAMNSFGTNDNCAGVSYSNRIDVQDIREFIEFFLQF